MRPAFRSSGVGKLLAEAIIEEAQQIGYRAMRLDTVPKLESAMRLYESLGFARRDAYYETPVGETVSLEKVLRGAERKQDNLMGSRFAANLST